MTGCAVSQCRMPSSSIIPALDILKDGQSGLFPGSELSVVDQLGFHGFEKTFCHGIIPTVASPAHTLQHWFAFKLFSELLAGILYTAVGVKQQRLSYGPVPHRHPPGGHTGHFRFHRLTQGPAYHLPVSQVQHRRQVEPALLGFDVGQVRNPFLRQPGGRKIPVQVVLRDGKAMV
jgi:hypothetical protein